MYVFIFYQQQQSLTRIKLSANMYNMTCWQMIQELKNIPREWKSIVKRTKECHRLCKDGYCINGGDRSVIISNQYGHIAIAFNKYDAKIYGFQILPEYRCYGHGSRMLLYAMYYVKNKGYRYVTGELWPDYDEERRHRFYKTNGFQILKLQNEYVLFKCLDL